MDRSPNLGLAQFQVIRRTGEVVAFNPEKIAIAITKAFIAVEGLSLIHI